MYIIKFSMYQIHIRIYSITIAFNAIPIGGRGLLYSPK